MKYNKLLLIVLITGMSFSFRENNNVSESMVIVELFTSEGCSSCPAADELLQEMPGILNKENKQVIGISFHVTYWNRLGWEDPYSNELYTERQKKYVSKLELPQVYTPQAIVNGETEFVGSNPVAFRDLVTSALMKSHPYEIQAQVAKESDKINLRYELNRDPKNIVLNMAVVEVNVVHYIPRGENKNRTLKHSNVVRVFETIAPQKSGNMSIRLPQDLAAEKCSIVLYTQNPKTLKINGVTKLDLE
ncbi:MAG: DUF1223 domain-containing protein [Cyclobacteriaceae bacterium]